MALNLIKWDKTLLNYLDYNTYAKLEDIDLFMEISPIVAVEFMGLDDELKKKLLHYGSRLVDQKNKFAGRKTYCNQPLKFPRTGIYNDCDDVSDPNCSTGFCSSGTELDPLEIPVNIIYATVLEAINIHKSQSLELPNPNATIASVGNVKREEIGCVNREYFKNSESMTEIVIKPYADELKMLLTPYLIPEGCVYRISRG